MKYHEEKNDKLIDNIGLLARAMKLWQHAKIAVQNRRNSVDREDARDNKYSPIQLELLMQWVCVCVCVHVCTVCTVVLNEKQDSFNGGVVWSPMGS